MSITPSPPCTLLLGLLVVAFESFFNGYSWVQPFTVKEVLVAWRRRMKKCLAFGV